MKIEISTPKFDIKVTDGDKTLYSYSVENLNTVVDVEACINSGAKLGDLIGRIATGQFKPETATTERRDPLRGVA